MQQKMAVLQIHSAAGPSIADRLPPSRIHELHYRSIPISILGIREAFGWQRDAKNKHSCKAALESSEAALESVQAAVRSVETGIESFQADIENLYETLEGYKATRETAS
jgi:hypothetical protein